jgi:hypothetical protein
MAVGGNRPVKGGIGWTMVRRWTWSSPWKAYSKASDKVGIVPSGAILL